MFRSELQELINAIRASGATPVISTQLMASNGDCAGMETYLGDTDEQRHANRALGEWITTEMRTAAAENHLLLIDCARKIRCDASLLGDAIHLTAKGHESVAECWVEAMQEVLHEGRVASENHALEDSILQEASQ
jgi:hypothetical protein